VAAGLAHSPALAARRAQIAAAQARETPAAALPDPMVEAALQNAGFSRYTVGTDENSMMGLEVRQGLAYPGKRAARCAAAQAETAQSQAELARLERSVAAQARAAYARLCALDGETTSLGMARAEAGRRDRLIAGALTSRAGATAAGRPVAPEV